MYKYRNIDIIENNQKSRKGKEILNIKSFSLLLQKILTSAIKNLQKIKLN